MRWLWYFIVFVIIIDLLGLGFLYGVVCRQRLRRKNESAANVCSIRRGEVRRAL